MKRFGVRFVYWVCGVSLWSVKKCKVGWFTMYCRSPFQSQMVREKKSACEIVCASVAFSIFLCVSCS